MFQLENVNKIYKNKETEFKALDNISLEIADQYNEHGCSPFERAYKLQRYDVRYSNTV